MVAVNNDAIVREIDINAPIERVWEAVTQAEHLGTWFGDSGATIELRPGGAMMLRWKDYGEAHAEVDVVEPPTRFVYRWQPTDEGSLTPGYQTLVEFTLSPAGKGTHLKVVESGFSSLSVSQEKRDKAFTDNTGGWLSEIDELKAYVEGRS